MKNILMILLALLLVSSCKKKEVLESVSLENSEINQLGRYSNCGSVQSPPTIVKDIIADFGATGNGVSNDIRAFLRAAQWINMNSTPGIILQLNIPVGTYMVGAQLAPNDTIDFGTGVFQNTFGVLSYGVDIMHLTNVSDVRIVGNPGAKIKILPGMAYGGRDFSGSACNYHSTVANCNSCPGSIGAAAYSSIGDILKIENCSCVLISDLLLDGNIQNTIIKGHYEECNGRELPYDGIVILGGSDIEIRDTDARFFGRDGIMTAYSNGNPFGVTLKSCNFVSNSRQAFSFTSGVDFEALNCRFDSTAMLLYNNPGAGVDIEPDFGSQCLNSKFTNCTFNHNVMAGMISDNKFPDVNTILFNNCTFYSSNINGYSIWPNHMINTEFNNCNIIGRVCHVSGSSSADHMKFNNCSISDWNGSFSSPVAGWNGVLLDLGAYGLTENVFFEFNNCGFELHHSKLIAIEAMPNAIQHSDRKFYRNRVKFFMSDLKNNTSGYPAIGWPTLNSGNTYDYDLGSFRTCELLSNDFIDSSPLNYSPLPLNNFSQICYWLGITNNSTYVPASCCVCNQLYSACSCTVSLSQRINNSDSQNNIWYNGGLYGPLWGRVFGNHDQECLMWGISGSF